MINPYRPAPNADSKKTDTASNEPIAEQQRLRAELAKVTRERDAWKHAWIKLACADDVRNLTEAEFLDRVARASRFAIYLPRLRTIKGDLAKKASALGIRADMLTHSRKGWSTLRTAR